MSKYKKLWLDKSFIVSVLIGMFFLIGSFFANYGAMKYTVKEAGSPTTDILLDNLPVINVDVFFSEGAFSFVVFLVVLLAMKPKTIPFTLKSVALFIFIRSSFIIMTHIGPYPDHIVTDLNSLKYTSSGTDLFFSGHTGLPFLLALLFWDNKWLRLIFIFCSIAAAAAVIFGHLHYTIDVFSAYFITYGISHIAHFFFSKDADRVHPLRSVELVTPKVSP